MPKERRGLSGWATICAIIGIIILEAIALIQGIDGAILSIAIAAIAGLGGFQLKSKLTKK